MRRLLAFVSLLLALSALPTVAQDLSWAYGPTVPTATGSPHPEGNEYMRKHHMEMLKHDRNLTMRDGNRDIDASLKQCFDCHTVKDETTGDPVTYQSPRHFCRACHDFVAVKVDCFMCHRSTPDGFEEPAPFHARLLDLTKPTDLANVEQYIASLDAGDQ